MGFWKKVAMISFYSLTTSVGICIGIGTFLGNGGESGETQSVLITIGVIDAICGGLLLPAGNWLPWRCHRHGHHGSHWNLGLGALVRVCVGGGRCVASSAHFSSRQWRCLECMLFEIEQS